MKKTKILLPALVLVLMLTMLCGCAKDEALNGDKIAFTLTVVMRTNLKKSLKLQQPRPICGVHLRRKTLFQVRSRNTGCLSPQLTAKQLITARMKDGGVSQKTASQHLRE